MQKKSNREDGSKMLLLEVQEKKNNKFRTCEQVGMINGSYVVYHNNGDIERVIDGFLYLKELFENLQLYQFIKVVNEHKTVKLQDNYYLVNVL